MRSQTFKPHALVGDVCIQMNHVIIYLLFTITLIGVAGINTPIRLTLIGFPLSASLSAKENRLTSSARAIVPSTSANLLPIQDLNENEFLHYGHENNGHDIVLMHAKSIGFFIPWT